MAVDLWPFSEWQRYLSQKKVTCCELSNQKFDSILYKLVYLHITWSYFQQTWLNIWLVVSLLLDDCKVGLLEFIADRFIQRIVLLVFILVEIIFVRSRDLNDSGVDIDSEIIKSTI